MVTGTGYGQAYYTNGSEFQQFSTGFGYSVKLGNANNLKITTSMYTEPGGTVYGSYQHAMVNTSLANLDSLAKNMIIDKDREYQIAEEYREKLKTKTPSVRDAVATLSGGNQQKVLLAKWMFAEPDVLIMDEPTRGIDVGAKYEIYCIINDLAASGKSVIMISSELPEVLAMSDRIYIMNAAKIVGEMKASEATQENIMAAILKSGRGD